MNRPNLVSREDFALARPDARPARAPLNIYYLHPLLAGPLADWREHLARARTLGFTHLCVGPIFAPAPSGDIFLTDDFERTNAVIAADQDADTTVRQLAQLCREAGLHLLLDLVLDRVAAEGAMARSAPHWFYRDGSADVVDPREKQLGPEALPARFAERAHELTAWWTDRVIRLAQAGAAGFRLLGLDHVPAHFLGALIGTVRQETRACLFLGWTPGLPWPRIPALESAGFDAVFCSSAWWDGRAPWFIEEQNLLRHVARIIGVAEGPFEERLAARFAPADTGALQRACRRALRIAATTGQGLLVPMGFEFAARRKMDPRRATPEDFSAERAHASPDLNADIVAANGLAARLAGLGGAGEMRSLSGPGAPVTMLLEADAADVRAADEALLVLINNDDKAQPLPTRDALPPSAGAAFTDLRPLDEAAEPLLGPGEVRVMVAGRSQPVVDRARRSTRPLAEALKAPRVAIERVTPSVDGGAFPIKRVIGQSVTVEADAFTDGHELIAVELLWKAVDEKDWIRVPCEALGNDRWTATFKPTRIGRHQFTIEAWRDDFASLCHDIEVKHKAGVDIALELIEARQFLEQIEAQDGASAAPALDAALAALQSDDRAAALETLLSPETVRTVSSVEERAFVTQHPPIAVEVDRPQAEFASWYELFPRSQSGDPARHGTFDDVIARLPYVRQMGFDVLYFPPIHPIGMKHRKGRNNSPTAAPGEIGSPYAIGSHEGGHDAIHPQLGTPQDFRRLVAAAHEHGLEIALDYAIQCSPDHPWLRDHPSWFRWRPDGTIKYAENPPKKYQDIVNVDFYGGDPSGLWSALRDVVLFWVDQGVRIFRVDNPHTKPLPFWQWMIAEVRARHPDVIFLSEAFTRPRMMYRLAKIGFTQSYTYFTWRNSKHELADYLTELTTTEVREFFRPHFFVNTPDINPYFLQTSGRPGFLIRAALAATLSGLWGVYSGFELCEGAPLPGREEYLDSEKYEIRIRDDNAPGNIIGEIAALNRIRKAHPALQTHLGVRFYNAFNDQILLYGKMAPSGADMILVAVSMDPHHVQEATFELPLWEWKLPDHGSLLIEDLMRGHRFVWTGKLQHLRLDPHDLPFAIWRIAPPGGAA